MTKQIDRFSFAERASHWISAACFLYAALTGLALWSPKLFWLSGVFGGGEGEKMFRSMQVEEFAKSLTQRGGIGIAASVKREILKMQEHKS